MAFVEFKNFLEDHRCRLTPVHVGAEMRRSAELSRTMNFFERAVLAAMENSGTSPARVAAYAGSIASALGMCDAEVDQIMRATLLYDIGMLGIPRAILKRRYSLASEERDELQSHTTIGHALLSSDSEPLLRLGSEIALGHHEHWDGTGYPNQLRGDAIPLAARIVAVADCFEALTIARSRNRARQIERAVNVMKNDKGHFDPRVMDALIDALPTLTAIKKMFDYALVESHTDNVHTEGCDGDNRNSARTLA